MEAFHKTKQRKLEKIKDFPYLDHTEHGKQLNSFFHSYLKWEDGVRDSGSVSQSACHQDHVFYLHSPYVL